MKVLNKITGEKTKPLDLALLGITVAGYGIAMALAAGLALMGRENTAAEKQTEESE